MKRSAIQDRRRREDEPVPHDATLRVAPCGYKQKRSDSPRPASYSRNDISQRFTRIPIDGADDPPECDPVTPGSLQSHLHSGDLGSEQSADVRSTAVPVHCPVPFSGSHLVVRVPDSHTPCLASAQSADPRWVWNVDVQFREVSIAGKRLTHHQHRVGNRHTWRRHGRHCLRRLDGRHIGLMRQMASELADQGISANAIAPGQADTPLTEVLHSPAFRAACIGAIPMRRYGLPAEMVGGILSGLGRRCLYHRSNDTGRRRLHVGARAGLPGRRRVAAPRPVAAKRRGARPDPFGTKTRRSGRMPRAPPNERAWAVLGAWFPSQRPMRRELDRRRRR